MAPSLNLRFESCVVSDGNQTAQHDQQRGCGFESCVVSDGNQTTLSVAIQYNKFESCVVSDGNQTLTNRRKLQ